MIQQRKQYSAAKKVEWLRRHLVEDVPVPVICEQSGIHPTVFYRWQREFFQRGHLAFERRSAEKRLQHYRRELRELRRRLQAAEAGAEKSTAQHRQSAPTTSGDSASHDRSLVAAELP